MWRRLKGLGKRLDLPFLGFAMLIPAVILLAAALS